jgi:uncharacterized protein (DUF1810 family)
MSATLELERFVLAQEDAGTYERAVGELRAARKRSHWMWFVFPQVAGLGESAMSRRYAIASIDEARAYLEHPLLGTRLLECARIVSELQVYSAQDVFGVVDTLKLHSSMTLFARAAHEEQTPCHDVLARYFDGARDAATERILDVGPPPS